MGFLYRVVCLLIAPAILPPSLLAQEITVAELEGTLIESKMIHNETSERGGKQSTGRVQSDVLVVIGPGGAIVGRLVTTWRAALGVRRGRPQYAFIQLERPGTTMNAGGGHFVAVYSDNTLTYLRTFNRGGLRIIFELARTPTGIGCAAARSYLREDGANEKQIMSAVDGQPTTVLSDEQISSTCRVMATPPGVQLARAGAEWQKVVTSGSIEGLREFILKRSGSPYAAAARVKLRDVRGRAPDEKRQALQDIKRHVYDLIVADIGETILPANLIGGTCEPYKGYAGNKAIYFNHVKSPKRLAACISWEHSSLDRVVMATWRMRCSGEASKALEGCNQQKGNADCECQLVDLDGSPALSEATITKYFGDYLK